MAFEVDLGELQREEETNTDKILNKFMTKEDIEVKTEINAPYEFTTFEEIADNFNNLINFGTKIKITGKGKNKKTVMVYKHEFIIIPEMLKDWIKKYKINMVSHNRKSRLEVADILKAIKQQETASRSWLEKFTGMGKEK